MQEAVKVVEQVGQMGLGLPEHLGIQANPREQICKVVVMIYLLVPLSLRVRTNE
jgi:hypothetical protein